MVNFTVKNSHTDQKFTYIIEYPPLVTASHDIVRIVFETFEAALYTTKYFLQQTTPLSNETLKEIKNICEKTLEQTPIHPSHIAAWLEKKIEQEEAAHYEYMMRDTD